MPTEAETATRHAGAEGTGIDTIVAFLRSHRATRATTGHRGCCVFHTAGDAQARWIAAVRPGVEGRSLDALARQLVSARGFGTTTSHTGVHSVGVMEFESPIMNSRSQVVFEPETVLSIDIPMFNAPWGGLRVEDGIVVTEGGAARLNSTPHLLQICKAGVELFGANCPTGWQRGVDL